jgi:uncharacterized coiled-coil protein SlyX
VASLKRRVQELEWSVAELEYELQKLRDVVARTTPQRATAKQPADCKVTEPKN